MTGQNPDGPTAPPEVRSALDRERSALLLNLEERLETPMLLLAFAWLALLIGELVWGERQLFATLGTVIWAVFIVDFGVKVALAPDKVRYVARNWLGAISLLIPALRLFRVARALRVLQLARVGRGLRLVRVVGSVNRGMHALGSTLQRRGFTYVVATTLIVTFAGAAGMLAFERDTAGGLASYGDALWWTAMLLTTLGSQFWPESLEGRTLAFILSLYAIGVFGYLTATLATFFIGRDADSDDAELAGRRELAALRDEVAALRADLRAYAERSRVG